MPSWININPVANAVADEQNVEVGSEAWLRGGGAAFSGQTGGHWNYGWRFDSRLTQDYVRTVIANYGHRRIFYKEAPLRAGGYRIGGRPLGWTPQDPGDLPGGEAAYFAGTDTVEVSGPDVLHFHIGPLLAVADSTGGRVMVQGQMRDAATIACIMIRYYMRALAGMVRGSPGYLWGDRGCSNILTATVEAARRNLIEDADRATLSEYVWKVALPFYEKAPGHNVNQKDNGLPVPNFQTYNGLAWLLPAFHDLSNVLPAETPDAHRPRVEAVVRRWCQWLADLDEAAPDLAGNFAAFAGKPEILAGKDGKPLDSLAGLLTAQDVLKGQQADLWHFRAGMIAEAVLGEPAKPLADKLRASWLPKAGDTRNRVWVVGADGAYA